MLALALSLATFPSLTTVVCYDDQFDLSAGVVVRITDSSGGVTMAVTDDAGRTPLLSLPSADQIDVLLGERSSRRGMLVGTSYSFSTPAVDPQTLGLDDWYLDIEVSQPLATHHLISGSLSESRTFDSSGVRDWWAVSTIEGSEIRFTTAVASLPNPREIGGVLDYWSFVPPVNEAHRVGVIMMMPSINLGSNAPEVVLSVDCEYSGFQADPVVDAYLLVDPPAGGDAAQAPLDPLELKLVSWEDSVASISLEGTCPEGRLLVLLRDGVAGPGGTWTHVVTAPKLDLPVDGGDGQVAVGEERWLASTRGLADDAVQECTPLPPAPAPGIACVPDAAESEDDCPATAGETECASIVRPTTNTSCGSPGSKTSYSYGKTTSHKFGFVVKVEKKGVPVGGQVAYEGGWSSQSVEIKGHSFQPGTAGVGQCVRWYVIGKTCRRETVVKSDRTVWRLDWVGDLAIPYRETIPCDKTETVKTFCHEQSDFAAVCSMTVAE